MKKYIISIIAGLITILISLSGILNRFDYMLTDAVYQTLGTVDNRIKLIAIDEKSMNELGAYKQWDRSLYAELLNKLYEDPECSPSLVAFDMIFQGDTNPESDEKFAEAAENAGNVVCAANIVFSEKIEIDEAGKKYLNRFHTELIEYPYDSLNQNVSVGFADSIQDGRDAAVREFYPVMSDGENEIPAFSLAIARRLNEENKMDILLPDTEPGKKLIIRYSGRPGDYEALSFTDVLNGRIPKEAFRDSIIIVGAYAPGMMDAFTVPSSRTTQMYGAEIHANILQSISEGKYMVKADKIIYSLIYGLIAAVVMLLAQMLPIWISACIDVVIIVIQIMLGKGMADRHVFVPLIVLITVIVLCNIETVIYKYVQVLKNRQRVLKAFRQYVAPQVVENIARKGDYELKLGGEKRNIAVLFVDIRGFTPLSEKLKPEQVVSILNEYLSMITKAIFDNNGTLDKFVGDAVMAVFNSPFDLDDYIYKAVCTAEAIVKGSDDIRKKAHELTGYEIGFGVGVNCGEAVVGNIGSDFRMDYTAIGDTVNTAARLEANAKAGQVLVSPSVVKNLEGRVEFKSVGEISLKGKSEPMSVYELKL